MSKIVLGVLAILAIGGVLAISAMASPPVPPEGIGPAAPSGSMQDVYIKALSTGFYDKTEVRVKAGMPVRLHFSTDGRAGCGSVLFMEDFGVRLAPVGNQEAVATFTPKKPGTYAYHCSMNMFRGKMVVE